MKISKSNLFYYECFIANKYAYKKYTYSFEKEIKPGSIIQAEYGKKKCYGVCLNAIQQLENSKVKNIKQIEQVYDNIIDPKMLQFIEFTASYNLISIGSVIELVIPDAALKYEKLPVFLEFDKSIKKEIKTIDNIITLESLLKAKYKRAGIKKFSKINYEKLNNYGKPEMHDLEFSQDQKTAIEKIDNLQGGTTCLLKGVTGSGKTLVALKGIYEKIAQEFQAAEKPQGKKILIITPEVVLGKSWANNIAKYFNQHVCFYNYQTSTLYKSSVFAWAQSNEPGIIIGARSALFLPYKNLAAIIIDEEHSQSLKQERYPRYHARDMALMKAKYENIPCLLLSATPSLETQYNIKLGKYEEAILSRTPKHGLAKFKFVKQEKEMLAPEILKEMDEAFAKKQQVLLFLNRKGYAPYCICNECSALLKCAGCDCAKIFYSNHKVLCHKCSSFEPLPNNCPYCAKNTTWKLHGIGIERLAEFAKEQFANKKFEIITSDTKEIEEQLEALNEGKIDCLIATQVLAQGHDFKNISLAIIVDGDMGINSPDFRSSERMLQLWQQIRGRSARHETPGKLIVQASSDESKFIKLFQNPDPYKMLMEERKAANWPPFSKCAFIIIKSKNIPAAKDFFASRKFIQIKTEHDIEFYGPLYVGKQNFIHEWRFLIKAVREKRLDLIMQKIVATMPKAKQVHVEFEMDPYTFL